MEESPSQRRGINKNSFYNGVPIISEGRQKNERKHRRNSMESQNSRMSDVSKKELKYYREYGIVNELNKFREKLNFNSLKLKISLSGYAQDFVLGLEPNIVTESKFVVMSTVGFYDVVNPKSNDWDKLIYKWSLDSDKINVLLASGNTIAISFFEGDDDKSYIALIVVDVFTV